MTVRAVAFPPVEHARPFEAGNPVPADFPAGLGIRALVQGIALRHHDRMQERRQLKLAASPLVATAAVAAVLVTVAACAGSAWAELADHAGVAGTVLGAAV